MSPHDLLKFMRAMSIAWQETETSAQQCGLDEIEHLQHIERINAINEKLKLLPVCVAVISLFVLIFMFAFSRWLNFGRNLPHGINVELMVERARQKNARHFAQLKKQLGPIRKDIEEELEGVDKEELQKCIEGKEINCICAISYVLPTMPVLVGKQVFDLLELERWLNVSHNNPVTSLPFEDISSEVKVHTGFVQLLRDAKAELAAQDQASGGSLPQPGH